MTLYTTTTIYRCARGCRNVNRVYLASLTSTNKRTEFLNGVNPSEFITTDNDYISRIVSFRSSSTRIVERVRSSIYSCTEYPIPHILYVSKLRRTCILCIGCSIPLSVVVYSIAHIDDVLVDCETPFSSGYSISFKFSES